MKTGRFPKYAYIILWVLWIMLCVRFSFRIGLVGLTDRLGDLSTILFVGAYCVFIPVSLLLVRKGHIRRLIWAAVPLCAAGIGAWILFSETCIHIALALLSAGSALLTASFLFIYVYGLTRQEQAILIIAFLIAKPVFSLAAVLFTESSTKLLYMILAAAVITAIAFCAKFIDTRIDSANKTRTAGISTPLRTFTSIFALYALIVFEKMNCVFTLSVKGAASPIPYYLYFAGGLVMAFAAYWMFVHKKIPVTVSLEIFLFSTVVHFIISIAAGSGLMASDNAGMIFFGISDIIYVFLFVTAASISGAYPNKKMFMGFVCVFGFGLLSAYAFSHYLYIHYKSLYAVIYSLASLAMIALCILILPSTRRIEKRFIPKAQINQFVSVSMAHHGPDQNSAPKVSEQLTARENEIVGLYLKGHSNQQISEMLHISPATVKVHCRNIYEKLKIKSRLELHFLFHDQIGNEDGPSMERQL